MIRALLLLLLLASSATAKTARVISGEHDGFTRLVIELPTSPGWTFGRTEDGYAFAVEAETQPGYDLSAVWRRIPKTRLTALQADPQTGMLVMTLGCDCHILPFEYRPGVIVLDIKPGPAPPRSIFEAAFIARGALLPLTETESGARGYDWLAVGAAGIASPATSLPLPLGTGSVSLEPLRDELLEQLARGAAEGIVDLELPGRPRPASGADPATLPWSHIRVGEAPGVMVTVPNALSPDLPPGSGCPDPSLLDLPGWGGASRPHDLLVETRSGLYGEFDVPAPEAILHATRVLLYLGFGAEARQTAELLGRGDSDAAVPLYLSMARIVDGESDPQTPFAAMLGCEGPASLWAALARDRLPAGPEVNRDAILRAFAALPAHLRRTLGPSLAEKFLVRSDSEAARIISDAMRRSPDADMADVALLDAKSALDAGNPEAAQAHAETAVALEGDEADNLIALVEAHFGMLDPLAPETAMALQALQGESAGTETGPAVDRAVILALALSGQFSAAFQEPAAKDRVLADLWRVTSDRATDDDFLTQAVLPANASSPAVPPEIGLSVAKRLLSLGFPDAAQVWLGAVLPGDAPDRRVVAAEAALMRGDARAAVALTEGSREAAASLLRARALVQLGDLAGAESALSAAGDGEAAIRIGPWKGDWASLDPALPAPWLQAADLVISAPSPAASGLLGRSGRAIEDSAASRLAIEALLASVTGPAVE